MGYLDDLYVTAVMVEEVRKGAGDHVVERNWELETPVVPFLERVIERAEEYFEGPETRVEIFEYLGYAGLEERIVPSS